MMMIRRRALLTTLSLFPLMGWKNIIAGEIDSPQDTSATNRVLSSFDNEKPYVLQGASWRGVSDRVMGGRSQATLERSTVAGRSCARLKGTVTRESNGGFIQMALSMDRRQAVLDASGYRGIELLVYGNNEDYNVHLRTPDCRRYGESYRRTFFAAPAWQRIQLPWSEFAASGVRVPLDTSRLTRIAIVGWMREFEADIALAEISLYA